MMLNRDLRSLGHLIFEDKKGRRRHTIRPKPGIGPRSQILPQPIGTTTQPRVPTIHLNLPNEVVEQSQIIKNPHLEAVQIRESSVPKVPRNAVVHMDPDDRQHSNTHTKHPTYLERNRAGEYL